MSSDPPRPSDDSADCVAYREAGEAELPAVVAYLTDASSRDAEGLTEPSCPVAVGPLPFSRAEIAIAAAPSGDRLIGACGWTLGDDRVAICWFPRASTEAIARDLLARVVAEASTAGAAFCQMLQPLQTATSPQRDAFERIAAGILHPYSTLDFLSRVVTRGDSEPTGQQTQAESSFASNAIRFREADRACFEAALGRTFVRSLDSTELHPLQTNAEALAGIEAVGDSGTARWWRMTVDADAAGTDRSQPSADDVGLLMLAEHSLIGAWEIAYLGVVPEARGRGIGDELVRLAIREAVAAGVPQLFLAVDRRNAPAIALYRRHGFEPFDTQRVWTERLL